MNSDRQAHLLARQGKDCDDCNMFIPEGRCTLVTGTISPDGICARFKPGDHAPKGAPSGTASKSSVGYFVPASR